MERNITAILERYLRISKKDERKITDVLSRSGYTDISEISNESRQLSIGCGEVTSREVGMRGVKEGHSIDVLSFLKPKPNIGHLFSEEGPALKAYIELGDRLSPELRNRCGRTDAPIKKDEYLKIIGDILYNSIVIYHELGSLDNLEAALPKFETAREYMDKIFQK